MNIERLIFTITINALKELYNFEASEDQIQIQNTRKDFEGDLTLVVFPFLRFSKKSPEKTGEEIGAYLEKNIEIIESFNVIKGFLNFVISKKYWLDILNEAFVNDDFGLVKENENSDLVMVEYSSPNTNKPLHLGHIRNNLLGYSISEILKANGKRVVKTNIVNDRGIHICKSMFAWQKWGKGKTPENSGIKGDHLVGEFYVEFDKHFRVEVAELVASGMAKEEAENQAPSIIAARELLLKWEAKDKGTIDLWEKMNAWVYKGFDVTYKKLGVDFDKIYYESDTYLIGKEEVLRGVNEGFFYKEKDSSVWADLTSDGLDKKILLRNDGTSVYITQDIGTAKMRFADYPIDKMVYVVGNEQNYHFQVLSVLLDKLGYDWGKGLHHFSYGMVELPSGKMKSREGKVVDADDLIEEMVDVARKMSTELGKLDTFSEVEAEKVYRMIALGALKYFILKVDPKKNMLFNPEESIDFNGNTGAFVQYTYTRIKSVLRKAADKNITVHNGTDVDSISIKEKDLVKRISLFPAILIEAGDNYSPAILANYCYELAKEYNQFYHDHFILIEPEPEKRNFRLVLSATVGKLVKKGMSLLGVEMPERM
ncbi:MAG: arginine--tRNA ligase [Prolixibacteraceae bacterium]|jgi:arginyl-tRNA synthetase|nr:arginine--tRNA ligase [Prolixibacteraceae bacterium]MBT6006817.1 arginine--tRNA ligase [Prolixibacteraceae bacterium]MBT6766054.1 arginine--tRNA ligase [Prolixibacteraceae bacterium]MBT6998457.1 arginine--tRNA ligase [Prolixibacteraceae bacterium]MBT7394384.1 arginine--tRNA ligase [Prolixibacteraceae bacterium]